MRSSRSYRVRWWFMFLLSAGIGFLCLLLRWLEALADGRLYCHPAPVRALLETARGHAAEYVKTGRVRDVKDLEETR